MAANDNLDRPAICITAPSCTAWRSSVLGQPTAREHFRHGLGAYPLRNVSNRSGSSLLLIRRSSAPRVYGRGTHCAFTAAPSNDPKSRKQALVEDRQGWTSAERAEIANHQAN
eukprot:3967355-Pleurochrysis_carterae.AAC.1